VCRQFLYGDATHEAQYVILRRAAVLELGLPNGGHWWFFPPH
jgi:hypothetical protein